MSFSTAWLRLRALARRPRFDAAAGRWRAPAPLGNLVVIGASQLGIGRRPSSEKVYEIRLRHAVREQRPKIVHVIPNIHVGGSTQLVVDLHDHLGHAWDMSVVTASLPPRGRIAGMDIHVHPLPGDAVAIEATLRRLAPDLVHVHYWGSTDRPWYDAAFTAIERLGLPAVQNINTRVPRHPSPSVRRDVFVSACAQAVGARDPGVRADIVHPGIDRAAFEPPETFDPQAADSIGMVYRLERDKLGEDSILPMIEVARRRPRTRCIVIGDGSLLVPFVRRVEAAGVSDNFLFAGMVPYGDLPAWYARFRIFVAPVIEESFGQVAPFAMAMGSAVAGYRVEALEEILESDETLGATASETADRILALLDDPERREAIGRRNRAIAERRFHVEAMTDAYAAIYADLLAQSTTADDGATAPS